MFWLMCSRYGVTNYIEGGVVTAVIVLDVLIGFYKEFQAEKKMYFLRALSSHRPLYYETATSIRYLQLN